MGVPVKERLTVELKKESSIITVCGKGGGRSEQAAATLRNLGFVSARSLCGGTQAWVQAETKGAING